MTPRTAIAALLTLFLLAHTFAPRSIHAAGRAPRVGPAPDWVLKIDPPPAGAQSSQFVATYCLLMDEQHDLATACGFYHFAVLLLNHQGIQDASDISVRYDPSYQSLTFHSVRIHRGSRIIDKLETDAIRTFQRETNLERSMYDGSLTASINLSDVRVGDIIEYSYSRCGQHPAYAEHRFGGFGLETFFAAELYSLRLRVPDEMHVTFREQGTSVKPEVSREAGVTTYRWNQQQVQATELEDNVPRWYLMTSSIRFSDFANWTEVAHWAIPLFEVTGAERDRLHALAQDSIAAADLPARVLETIRFVQNEIRYLALEEGLSAYRPHPPTQVWKQRYGDCKDKALLLSALLFDLGIEAHPMLVNSGGIRSEDKCILAPADFDHCIVTFRMDGQRYFVDPTDSHQGGDLQHLSVGDFRYGLIIAPFTNGLTALPEFDPGKVLATERFYLDSSGGAKLVVSTEYWGPQADLQRFLFATNDPAGIQKSYVAYYAQVYPTIEPTTSIVYHDDRRDTDNMFLIEEAYRIPDIWTPEEEDTTIHHLELMPIEFKSLASWDKAPGRKAPFGIIRVHRRHETIVQGPRIGFIEPRAVSISGDLFEYAKKIAVENDAVDIVHEYRCTGSYVEPGDLSGFVSKHDKIRAELVSIMIDPQSVAANGRMNWIMVACYVAAVIASVWAARRIYVRYDPEPRAPVGDGVVPRLGGWLLLPAFAIIVALCREVYDLSQLPQVFDSGIHSWFSATHHVLFMLLIMVDACRMVTLVLLAFTFFHRRSSAPFIFIAYFAVTWLVALGTKGLMGEGTGEEVSQTAPAYFMLAMIAAAWVAYFIRSDRVKRTFVARGPLHARRDSISDPFASFIA